MFEGFQGTIGFAYDVERRTPCSYSTLLEIDTKDDDDDTYECRNIGIVKYHLDEEISTSVLHSQTRNYNPDVGFDI